jgi:hypothetical protein
MTITPGYDFEQSEIPTQAKLRLMVSGMSVDNVDVSLIDTALIGFRTSDTSASLPGEGWCRLSPQGALWVQTRWGEVEWYRAGWGGLVTRRLGCGNVITTNDFKQRRPVAVLGRAAGTSTGESNWRLAMATPAGTQAYALSYRTVDSSGTSPDYYPRTVLFGGCIYEAEARQNVRLQQTRTAGVPSNDLMGVRTVPYSAAARDYHLAVLTVSYQTTGVWHDHLSYSYGICEESA